MHTYIHGIPECEYYNFIVIVPMFKHKRPGKTNSPSNKQSTSFCKIHDCILVFLVVDFDCRGARYGKLGICFYPLDCKRVVGTTGHPLEVMSVLSLKLDI